MQRPRRNYLPDTTTAPPQVTDFTTDPGPRQLYRARIISTQDGTVMRENLPEYAISSFHVL